AAHRRRRVGDVAGAQVVAVAHTAAGARAAVLPGALAERAVKDRRGAGEDAPRALAAGHDPRVAHPAGRTVGLATATRRALLGRRGAVTDHAAGTDAQAVVAVVVVVVAGEALGGLGRSLVHDVVRQPDDPRVVGGAVVEDHLRL